MTAPSKASEVELAVESARIGVRVWCGIDAVRDLEALIDAKIAVRGPRGGRGGMRYRKKPVVIEAELFLPETEPLPFSGRGDPCCLSDAGWYIYTLEGNHELCSGDMVIRGVKGEFYPCKPDIFEMTYEKVEGA